MSDPCTLRLNDDGEMVCMNHRSMLDAASDTRCEFMHIEWAESQIETLHDEVERLTAELADRAALMPEWRRMVDEVGMGTLVYPLSVVLRDISYLDVATDKRGILARIVAVCEDQVGDGWQADPTYNSAPRTVWELLTWFVSRSAEPHSDDWATLAVSAAAWLKSLTEGGAA